MSMLHMEPTSHFGPQEHSTTDFTNDQNGTPTDNNTMSSWPTLSEAHVDTSIVQQQQQQQQREAQQQNVHSNDNNEHSDNSSSKSSEDWEFVSDDDDDDERQTISISSSSSSSSNTSTPTASPVPIPIHKSISTPEFGKIHRKMMSSSSSSSSVNTSTGGAGGGGEEDESYVLDCSSSSIDIDAQSNFTECTNDRDAILLSHHTSSTTAPLPVQTVMKKVPSFKDIMLLNAQEKLKEEIDRKKEEEERRQEALIARRNKSKVKPRLIVTKTPPVSPVRQLPISSSSGSIRRCSKSTGDLRSLVSIQEDEDHYDGAGGGGFGGGGGGGGETIHEEEVLGETDAMDFYHRKAKGGSNRSNGMKLRPDEKKRKEWIISKKNAQRAKQSPSSQKGKQSKASSSSSSTSTTPKSSSSKGNRKRW